MGEGYLSISVFLWWVKDGFCGNLVIFWYFINNLILGLEIIVIEFFFILLNFG